MENKVRALVFDLGGVLCQLNDPMTTFGFDESLPDFMRRWLSSPSVREFECGQINAESFAVRIIREADLPFDPEEFLRRFDNWSVRLFPGVIELLEKVSEHYTCAVLSNTNAKHWCRSDLGPTLTPYLHTAFLSFETGLFKPDPEAFLHVIDVLSCQPDEIVFFDDSPVNIQGARTVGIHAVLVDSYSVLQHWIDDNLDLAHHSGTKKP